MFLKKSDSGFGGTSSGGDGKSTGAEEDEEFDIVHHVGGAAEREFRIVYNFFENLVLTARNADLPREHFLTSHTLPRFITYASAGKQNDASEIFALMDMITFNDYLAWYDSPYQLGCGGESVCFMIHFSQKLGERLGDF